MESPTRRPVFALIAAFAIAASCAAAPGLAGADGVADGAAADAFSAADSVAAADNPATAEPSPAVPDATAVNLTPESDAADDGATAYALGGVQFSIPDGFEVVDLGSMALASNADGSVVVSVTPSGDEASVPASPDEWGAYFASFAQAAVSETAGTQLDEGLSTLADGTEAYVFRIGYGLEDGGQMTVAQCYVPLDDGTFTLVQVACTSDEEAGAAAEGVLASVELATDAATQLGTASDQAGSTEGAATGKAVEAGGITFDLPAGLVADESSTDGDPTWYSEDGTLMLGVMPALIDGYSTVGKAALDLIADGIAQSLGGTIDSSSVIEHDGTAVNVYVFTFSSEGQEFVGALGMVALDDDTVTGVLALTPMLTAAVNDAAVASVFDSIRVAG